MWAWLFHHFVREIVNLLLIKTFTRGEKWVETREFFFSILSALINYIFSTWGSKNIIDQFHRFLAYSASHTRHWCPPKSHFLQLAHAHNVILTSIGHPRASSNALEMLTFSFSVFTFCCPCLSSTWAISQAEVN